MASKERSTRSFEHGERAAGAWHVREGYTWAPEDDLAFALGYPYVSYLVEDHPDDKEKKLEARAERVISGSYPVEIPARIARARARVYPVYFTDHTGKYDKKVILPLVEREDPITPKEAKQIIETGIQKKGINGMLVWRTLQILEAVLGPSAIAELIVGAYEDTPDPHLRNYRPIAGFASYLAFSLLRVTVDESAALRKRLEKIYARIDPEESGSGASHEALGMALQKRPAECAGDTILMTDGPAEKIRKIVVKEGANPPFAPDARIVFLGGDELFAFYEKHAKKLDGKLLPEVVETLAPMRSAAALHFMLMLSSMAKAKREALGYFVERAELVRPFLEKTKKSKKEDGKWAAAVLAKLG